MKMNKCDICIIGGGAAGMTAAIAAASEDSTAEIVLLEKKEKLGKKLYATGNGRCNLSNMACRKVESVLGFFDSIGITTMADEEGRVYPRSQSAADVVFALESAVKGAGVRVIGDMAVSGVVMQPGAYPFSLGGIEARKLIIACGGKAGPQYGCSGDGFKLARALGHSVNRPYPVLTGMETEGTSELKGVRARGTAILQRKGVTVAEESGEIQFNDYGVSGICVMDLSRFLTLDEETSFSDYNLRLVLGPEDSASILDQRRHIAGLKAGDILLSIVNRKLAGVILSRANIEKSKRISELGDDEIAAIAQNLQEFDLAVRGARGWKYAQCTGGGIPYSEVDEETMRSRLVSGLYFAGEIMDYDGPCGGYNLDHAWKTGIKAGRAATNV
jgi:predicted Rossmann fold flavoprotein